MKLQTTINVSSGQPKIDYQSRVLLLGSCFSENIGAKFEYFKFPSLINPFGILFHPKAIETFLWMVTQKEKYAESDLFFHQGKWHCFDAHSRLSHRESPKLLYNLNNAVSETSTFLSEATHVCITLGTAWVYRLRALDMVVANCHKIPQEEFSKELMSVDAISQCLQNCTHLIRTINPKARLIFTISPVRHYKDGLVRNMRSKAHLIAAVHHQLDKEPETAYFPAYELMMDELRDYRYYGRDMLHPSEVAIDYIWESFKHAWVDPAAFSTMARVDQIQKSSLHRPLQPDSEEHHLFLQGLQKKIKELKEDFPFINF